MSKRTLVLAITFALLTASPAAIAHSHGSMPKIPTGQAQAAPMGGTFLNVTIPDSVLQLPLQNAKGEKFTLASLQGKTVLIANFLTSCQEICPMTTVNMQRIADRVAAAKASSEIVVLEITVDPLRDTPTRLRAYQKLYGSSNWVLATGTPANISALWKFFGAPATKANFTAAELKSLPKDWQTGKTSAYDMVHADLVLALSPELHWVWLDLGAPKTVDGKIPSAMKKFLSADGLKNLAKPEEPSWGVPAVLAALSTISGNALSLSN